MLDESRGRGDGCQKRRACTNSVGVKLEQVLRGAFMGDLVAEIANGDQFLCRGNNAELLA